MTGIHSGNLYSKANVGIIFKNATDYINFLKKLLP